MEEQALYQKTEEYFGKNIKQMGVNYAGVGWNGEAAQEIRYDQLVKLLDAEEKYFTVCDYGCGYGYFLGYLKEKFPYWEGKYFGIDSSATMIETAISTFREEQEKCAFYHSTDIDGMYDYIVASGVFNLKMGISEQEFHQYMLESIHKFDKSSRKGFSFNALTKYSDSDKMKDDLYYSDPVFWFDYCKRNFSRNVALLHDYGLYDFTIIVRKSGRK